MGQRAWTAVGILTLAIGGACFAQAQQTESEPANGRSVPQITAHHANPHPPSIDGRLDDPIWQSPNLTFARDFRQRDPDEGKAATESTLVAVAYDDDAVYVAFWCYDSEPDKVNRQLVRRDRVGQSDWVNVILDSYNDRQTGYEFAVTAAGALFDARFYNDDWSDNSWDAVWDAGVQMHPWGWSAELKIPYHALRFNEREEHVWGINFNRHVRRKSETSWWAFAPKSEKGFISKCGQLNGLTGISPARHLEVLPYMVSKAEITPKSPGNPNGRQFPTNTGLDLKYGLTSNLTLDATVNPDFGQVELDQPVLNLSAFETFFSEKRPFFMEGADLYNTPFTLFYSRRIGRPPTGRVNDEEFDYSIDRPVATSILGAAKLTGKLESGTSIGIVTALTEEEKESYRATNGERRDAVIEPLAGYSVMRIKQDVLGNSYVGGLMTLTSQDTRHPATTGGIDWRLNTPNNGWAVSGQTLFSRVDDQNTGFGGILTLHKTGGKHWRGEIGGVSKDPNFRINRLGFTSRVDERRVYSWIQYRTTDDWWIIRNTWTNLNLSATRNYNGDDIGRNANINGSIEFVNNWWLEGGVTMQAEKYSDLETRGNGLWEWPVQPTFSWWSYISTDRRRKLSFEFNPGSGSDRGGSWWAAWFGASYRPKSNIELSAGANYHRTFDGTRWVSNVDGNAIFADLDKDEVFGQLTASVMLSRDFSIQVSGQGLISALDYEDYKRYLGGNQYARDVAPLDRDGTFSALNTMLIARYEYRPGSTIYFVWTRSRPEFDPSVNNLAVRREFDRFFSSGSEHVWLLKMSYWWNI